MLSIGAMTAGQSDYYQKLAREDYYLCGGEPVGSWCGRGRRMLGLSGVVSQNDLSQLFEGFSPDGNALVQNAGKANRQCGWDLTFSAPKSVSVLWSQLDGDGQREVQAAHYAAVVATISYLERNIAFSRIGKGGSERIPVSLVVALFEHSCSRALDMQLHTHALVMNIGIAHDRSVRSLVSRPFYESKMLAGAFYRCELARQLQQRLSVDLERPPGRNGKASWFEVKGIAKNIICHFSKRREAILKELSSHGLESASAAAFAALGTREAKSIIPPRNELYARWKEEARALGFSVEDVAKRTHELSPHATEQRFQQAMTESVAQVTFDSNYFTERELTRRTLEIAQEYCLPAEMVAKRVAECMKSSPNLYVSLGTRDGQACWTTQEILNLEAEFIENVANLRGRAFPALSNSATAAAINAPRGKSDNQFVLGSDQQEAVRYLLQGAECIKCVSGFAGTGKTEMLCAVREALEKEGYRIYGTALSGAAARNLQEKAGIESFTIRAIENRLYPTVGAVLKHHASQLWRAAKAEETYSFPQLQLNHKSVLVVDEAGMVGVRDFALLARTVVEQGGTIIALGDERQLSAIERPGSFEFLVQEIGGGKLADIRRQRDAGDRVAVKDIALGNPEAALRHYATKGQFVVGNSTAQLERELLSDWRRRGGVERPAEHRIFAGTRAEVERINKLCQWERVNGGAVDASNRIEHNGQVFMAGDRVRFDVAARALGVRKGEGGTVLAVKDGFTGKYVSIALDADDSPATKRWAEATKYHARQLLNEALGKRVEKPSRRENIIVIPLKTLNPSASVYQGLSLDYAMTTHLAQGKTVPNSYVILGSSMTSRELSYVQMSRHQEQLFLYAIELQAGASLAKLARKSRPISTSPGDHVDRIPEYSSLTGRMQRSEAQQLASIALKNSEFLTQESQNVQSESRDFQ